MRFAKLINKEFLALFIFLYLSTCIGFFVAFVIVNIGFLFGWDL